MGLEVLILLKGRWGPRELGLPDTMACNVRGENTLIVPFPSHGSRYYPCHDPPLEYIVPGRIPRLEFEVLLSDWESGCLEEGKAVILCGHEGEKLGPEYVRKEPLPCQENALFYTRGHVRVTAHPSGEVLLERFNPTLQGAREKIVVAKEILWGGTPPLPPELRRFEDAVKAAVEKARCSGCRELHYAAMR